MRSADWNALVAELGRDPALAEVLGPHVEPGHRLILPEYPHPPALGETRRWATVGLAAVADNPLGGGSGKSRVRVPSVLGFVLPELGVMLSSDAPVSVYMGHGFPAYLLFAPRWALEVRPSFTLRFASARQPGPDALTAVSISLMHR